MLIKLLVTLLGALAYIYLLTVIFEYCINEASSTFLTTVGIVLFVVLSALYASLVFYLFKKNPKYPVRHD
jgi:hypothetical protein